MCDSEHVELHLEVCDNHGSSAAPVRGLGKALRGMRSMRARATFLRAAAQQLRFVCTTTPLLLLLFCVSRINCPVLPCHFYGLCLLIHYPAANSSRACGLACSCAAIRHASTPRCCSRPGSVVQPADLPSSHITHTAALKHPSFFSPTSASRAPLPSFLLLLFSVSSFYFHPSSLP